MNMGGSLIGKSSIISGRLVFSGDIYIHGHIEGTLSGSEDSRVFIAGGGSVCGNIEAGRVETRGLIEGNIQAGGLFVYAPGIVKGDVHASSVYAENGAEIFQPGQTDGIKV